MALSVTTARYTDRHAPNAQIASLYKLTQDNRLHHARQGLFLVGLPITAVTGGLLYTQLPKLATSPKIEAAQAMKQLLEATAKIRPLLITHTSKTWGKSMGGKAIIAARDLLYDGIQAGAHPSKVSTLFNRLVSAHPTEPIHRVVGHWVQQYNQAFKHLTRNPKGLQQLLHDKIFVKTILGDNHYQLSNHVRHQPQALIAHILTKLPFQNTDTVLRNHLKRLNDLQRLFRLKLNLIAMTGTVFLAEFFLGRYLHHRRRILNDPA